jgi:hypothetical protein
MEPAGQKERQTGLALQRRGQMTEGLRHLSKVRCKGQDVLGGAMSHSFSEGCRSGRLGCTVLRRLFLLGERLWWRDVEDRIFHTERAGTAEESDKAVKWWRAAASRGHGLANYTMGKLLADGMYVGMGWEVRSFRLSPSETQLR